MRDNSRKVGGDNIMGIEVGLRHFISLGGKKGALKISEWLGAVSDRWIGG